MLAQSPGPDGFSVSVTDAAVSGTIHLVTVSIGNDANAANNVSLATGGVLVAIDLQAKAGGSSPSSSDENGNVPVTTNLCLYNAAAAGRRDAIGDGAGKLYNLALPASLSAGAVQPRIRLSGDHRRQASGRGERVPVFVPRKWDCPAVGSTTCDLSANQSSDAPASGLQVTSVDATPTGFTVNFNEPFAVSSLHLYSDPTDPADIMPGLLVYCGNLDQMLPLTGSLVPDLAAPGATSATSFTYVDTRTGEVFGGLPDGTYTVSILSGAGGLTDVDGAPLDASNSPDYPSYSSSLYPAGTAAYTTTFTLATATSQSDSTVTDNQVALSLPAFTQGPGLPAESLVPYFSGMPSQYFGDHYVLDGYDQWDNPIIDFAGGTPGIPVILSDGDNLTAVTFSVTYDTHLLQVTGAEVDPALVDPSDAFYVGNGLGYGFPDAYFARTAGTPDANGIETDTFTFSTYGDGPLPSGPDPAYLWGIGGWPLGEILATVPAVNGQHIYKAAQLLTVGVESTNNDVNLPVVGGNGLQAVAYLGDGTGDGAITSADAQLANSVAVGVQPTYANGVPYDRLGLGAYPNVDPQVVADTDANLGPSLGAGAVSQLALFADGNSVATIPDPPLPPAGQSWVLPVDDPADLAPPGPLTDGSLTLSAAGLSYVSGSAGLVTVVADGSLLPAHGTATLTGITVSASVGGVAGTPVSYGVTGVTAGQDYRFADQVDAATLPTGRYGWQVTVVESYSDQSTLSRQYCGQIDLVNWSESPYELGPGWALSGVDYLVPAAAGVSVVEGHGAIAWFWANGDGTYRSEPGPYAFMNLTFTPASGGQSAYYTLTGTEGQMEIFDPQGRLLTVTDRDGNVAAYTWASGQLLSATDGSHHTTEYGYSGGRLVTMTDVAGRVTTLYYTGGQLTSIALPDPATGAEDSDSPLTQFGYDATTGLLTLMTDPDDHTTQYHYDSTYRLLTSVVHPDSTAEHYQSVAGAALAAASSAPLVASADSASYTDASAAVTSTLLDGFGLATSVTHYDAQAQLLDATAYQRDANGRVLQMSQPDPANAEQDSGSPVTMYQCDSDGNLQQETLPDGLTQYWTYQTKSTYGGPYDALVEHVDGLGHQTYYGIDSATGDVLDVEQAVGSTEDPDVDPITHYTYTPAPSSSSDPPGGLVASETDPLQNVTTYDYNAHGLLTQTTYADQTLIENAYDTSDDLTSQTNELGYATKYTYDNLGRELSMTEPDPANGENSSTDYGPVTTYAYDPNGNLLSEVDPLGRVTLYAYNALNELHTITSPGPESTTSPQTAASALAAYGNTADVTTMTYTPTGELYTVEDPLGRVTTYGYDALGRQVSATQPDPANGQDDSGSPVTSTAYDALGRVIATTDALGNTTAYAYQYNASGPSYGYTVTQTPPDPQSGDNTQADHGPQTISVYDADGNLVGETDPLNDVTDLYLRQPQSARAVGGRGHAPGSGLRQGRQQDLRHGPVGARDPLLLRRAEPPHRRGRSEPQRRRRLGLPLRL